ncbi:hypothetical protein A0H81_00835 [Grifola frondosa]|uniref:Uncharacterized protein n=1 Tax=Grifola frondosa TaxID=5627 RepID=A0A1C7MP64_GRIFR|nr:hypothetical protein A0H81_00835 [Grifola frondosa]
MVDYSLAHMRPIVHRSVLSNSRVSSPLLTIFRTSIVDNEHLLKLKHYLRRQMSKQAIPFTVFTLTDKLLLQF